MGWFSFGKGNHDLTSWRFSIWSRGASCSGQTPRSACGGHFNLKPDCANIVNKILHPTIYFLRRVAVEIAPTYSLLPVGRSFPKSAATCRGLAVTRHKVDRAHSVIAVFRLFRAPLKAQVPQRPLQSQIRVARLASPCRSAGRRSRPHLRDRDQEPRHPQEVPRADPARSRGTTGWCKAGAGAAVATPC